MMKPFELLITPWRMEYILSARHQSSCIFCNLLRDKRRTDSEKYILVRRQHAFLVLNIYPYSPGHLMAVPYEHAATPSELSREAMSSLLSLCALGEKALRRVYSCASVEIGANLGRAAGAGVPDHMHFHVVPIPNEPVRSNWNGADQIPEPLQETYEKLLQEIARIDANQ